jgi:hypothetical protein
MRSLKTTFGAGVAAIAAIGFCGVALAQSPQAHSPQIHTMTIALPGGGVEQIQYTGATAPRVAVSNAPAPVFVMMPSLFGAGFSAGSPFAGFERISAAMDRQADEMLRKAAALQAGAAQPNLAAISAMPAGSREYSFVSEMSGGNVCSRSMVITSDGSGAAPHVVTHTSGNCGAAVAAPGFQTPTQLPIAPAPANNGPRMIMTKAIDGHPAAGRVEEASLN